MHLHMDRDMPWENITLNIIEISQASNGEKVLTVRWQWVPKFRTFTVNILNDWTRENILTSLSMNCHFVTVFNQHFENNVGGGANQGLRKYIVHKTQLDKV